jgi:hypothetical protein
VSEPEKIVINKTGGKGSLVEARYDLVPQHGLKVAALRMAKGAVKYGEWNWHNCPSSEHLQHLLNHINEHRIDPTHPEDHPAGIAARALMFVDALVREAAARDAVGMP